MANKVLGLHRLKNKVTRNAFDLSHRHMFTAQIGELLPVFSQWVNPNETFKIGYNGKTRTASLNTDAFTRVRENIQYYFVPFQSLWKYFEQQVNNMTRGDAGQNISKFASSSTQASSLTTKLPYVSYVDLASWLNVIYNKSLDAVDAYFKTHTPEEATPSSFQTYSLAGGYNVFVCDGYRLCRAAKLLMSLGYGNFTSVIRYDLFAQVMAFLKINKNTWDRSAFLKSDYCLILDSSMSSKILNSPNLSILPLLAYHKICNDHYRNEKWQPFEPWTCNIDYLRPTDNMNAVSFIDSKSLISELTSLLDLENSNLPIDYFTSVLPRAQYGEDSVASLSLGSAVGTADLKGVTESDFGNWTKRDGSKVDASPVYSNPSYDSLYTESSGNSTTIEHTHKISGSASINTQLTGSLRISALRSATALQKYREIQNSNDPDFASQVLAHFGIKPKVDSRTSVFIGGDDKTISINPQVNTNFQDGGEPSVMAIGIGDLSAGCKFKSTTYGMIIGIYRAVPQLDYSRSGIDRNLFKVDATDFPIPELDSIGMQTQYRCELSAPLNGTCKSIDDSVLSSIPVDLSVTYGYSPRYAELKSSYDYYEGGFCGAYASWVSGFDDSFLSLWRQNLSSASILGIDDLFKCRPSILYSIFKNQWSGTVNDDKLLIGSVNTCVAVRPFSMYGLPYSK